MRIVRAAVAAALTPGLARATEPLPLGPPFRLNTGISGPDPQVAVDPAGNFMIVWDAFNEADEIRGRRFFATGIPAGPDFRVSEPGHDEGGTGDRDNNHAIAADTSGNFMVA